MTPRTCIYDQPHTTKSHQRTTLCSSLWESLAFVFCSHDSRLSGHGSRCGIRPQNAFSRTRMTPAYFGWFSECKFERFSARKVVPSPVNYSRFFFIAQNARAIKIAHVRSLTRKSVSVPHNYEADLLSVYGGVLKTVFNRNLFLRF